MLLLADVITNIIYVMFNIQLLSHFYPMRKNIKMRIPICIAIVSLRSVVDVLFMYQNYLFKVASFIIVVLLCSIIMQKWDRFRFLIINALSISVAYLSESLAICLFAIPQKKPMIELAESEKSRIPLIFLSVFLTVIIFLILDIIIKVKQSHKKSFNQRISSYEVLFFVIFVLFQILIEFGMVKIYKDEQLNVLLAFFSIGFCVLNFGIYFMLSRLAEARQIEHENQLMKHS